MSARVPTLEELCQAASQSGFRVKQFADLLGVEVRTLERRFDEAFSCPPDEWLAAQRMIEAGNLLQRGLSVKEVAAQVAYRHAPSFFREFRRRYGCTPMAYLEAQRISFAHPDYAPLSQTASLLSQTASSSGLRLPLAF